MKKVGRKRSIRVTLILYFTTIILVSLSALGLSSITVAVHIISDEAESNMIALAKESSKLEYSYLESKNKTLKTIVSLNEIKSMDWSLQQPLLKELLVESEFTEFGIISDDGATSYSNNETYVMDESEKIMELFHGELSHVEFLVSPVTGELVLIQAVPIIDNSQVVGVLLGRMDGSTVSTMASEITYGENGYGYFVDSKGTVIGHKDRDLVTSQYNAIEKAKTDSSLSDLARTIQDALTKGEGVGSYTFNGEKIQVSYRSVPGTDWTVILAVNESEIVEPINWLESVILLIVVGFVILGIVITYIIGYSISKPIIETSNYANVVASLDLTVKMNKKHTDRKDEIGNLARALVSITDGLKGIINQISESSSYMINASKNLLETSQQSSNTSQEIAKVVEEIAQGAADQAKQTTDGSVKGAQLGEQIEKVQYYIESVNDSSKEVTKVVEEGLKEVISLEKITQENTMAVKEIYDVIMKANESSDRIGEASSVIESIAARTNLLSLNAAIEAARAGDAGKGFAVVAEEIGKLAEQSSDSTKVINEIVDELQKNTQNAVSTMQRAAVITKEQINSVTSSKEKYHLIEHTMKTTSEVVSNLTNQGKEMNQMRQGILEVLEYLSAIAQENAAAAQEASAATEEQTASVEEIAASSDDLSELAVQFRELIDQFKR